MNKKMRARKRRQARRVALTLVLMLTVALVSIGGTIAWLTDSTEKITNTFTVGNIDIALDETKPTNQTAKMVPGATIDKDPTITVEGGSEASWLFVKIEEENDLDTFITYAPAAGWTELTAGSGIYYREVTASNADQTFAVLADNKVTVNSTVTKDMMDDLTEDTYPTLSFTAYAVQKDATIDTAAKAWSVATTGNLPTA